MKTHPRRPDFYEQFARDIAKGGWGRRCVLCGVPLTTGSACRSCKEELRMDGNEEHDGQV